jgi:hypothetical protein
MALAKNRQAVQELIKELEPLILGREREGFSCGCGAIHCGTAVAEAIIPAGDSYPGQETMWYLWSVQMKTHGEGSDWSCGLSFFVESNELEAMFNRYFGDQKEEEQSYKIEVDGADRVYEGLPAAVRINENDDQIRFSFSWGREQDTAKLLDKLYGNNPRRMPAGSEAYIRIVSLLEAIQLEVYRGGPDPELPHESKWHLDYKSALARALEIANHIFFQNMGKTYDWRGEAYTNTDVVFMKHSVK